MKGNFNKMNFSHYNKFLFKIGKALFLTPLIKAGKIKEAQHAAKVELLGQDVASYSGYFTVGQESCGSNLFFWFFPAMVNSMILFL